MAFEHRERGRGGLHLCIRDRALLLGRSRHGGIVLAWASATSARALATSLVNLVRRLLGLKVLPCQRAGSGELSLHIFKARV